MKVRNKSRFKMSEIGGLTRFGSIWLSLIFLVNSPVPSLQTSNFCDTKILDGSNQSPKIWLKDRVLSCDSAQPINWIIQHIPESTSGTETVVERPFRIETKVVACGNGQTSLAPLAPNTTIPYYFTSTFTIPSRNSSIPYTYTIFGIFCGVFPNPNSKSITFRRARLELYTDGSSGFSPTSILPQKPPKCDVIILDFDDSNEKSGCGCGSKSEAEKKPTSQPKFFACKDLISCRLLADSKFQSACEAKRVKNRCNMTSFYLPQSLNTGGILFCPSAKKNQAPYVLFFPMSQEVKTGGRENNAVEIQILGNDPANYEQFLNLSMLHPKAGPEITRKTGVAIQCKGPAFIFIQQILWTVQVDYADLEPNYTISGSKLEPAENGEQFVTTTLRILPNRRNTSSVVTVICRAQVNDKFFYVQSNVTVKLEVFKPQIYPDVQCAYNRLLHYFCRPGKDDSNDDVRVTWHKDSGEELEINSADPDWGKSFVKCPTETITCVATLPNGVKSSHKFSRESCEKFAKENSCTAILDESPTTTTSAIKPTVSTSTPTTTTTTTTEIPTTSSATYISNQTVPGPEKEKAGAEGATGLNVEIIVIIALGVCLLILVPSLIILLRKNRVQRQRLKLSDEEVEDFLQGNDSVHFLPYDTTLEIPKDQITIGAKVLGSGAFGKVVEGEFNERKVAIKTVSKSADMQYFKALLSEIKIMGFVGKHEHILELVGACTWDIKQRNVYVVFELCENGNLAQFLRKSRDNFENQLENTIVAINPAVRMSKIQRISMILGTPKSQTKREMTSQHLVRWSFEIASGMSVIAQKNIYHGDLAARNILLDENLVAKVGDFGLSRQLFEYSVYVQKTACPLPLKWMSIESLRDLEFSIQSDVWSFGITLWEIFSLGCQPYPNSEWNFTSWKNLLDGERMGKPDYATTPIYEIMLKCWKEKPSDRPTFAQLKTMFEEECKTFT